MNLEEYYKLYGRSITQESERLFVDDFLYPLIGSEIRHIVPQYVFIDSTGKSRRIDFAYNGSNARIAFEVNGESYHSEAIILNEVFDDNLFRQNEILRAGYQLVRFSYSQLQSPLWRPIVSETLRDLISTHAPELLSRYSLKPNAIQEEALAALDFYRNSKNWVKGVLVLPTGTGKTILSAIDAKRFGGPVLFLVHRLDILKQSINAFKLVWPEARTGILTGEERDWKPDYDILFASKDTLRKPTELSIFDRAAFNYIIVDEVHHGQSPTYREILNYFRPAFMVGMTGTPDRTDRKDIFELFDYNKILEISLSEAIERGYLVPFTYYGLTDNVDYSRIRYRNQRYRIDDLERLLIIPERNEAIVAEYLEKGKGDKCIGFCVSIDHANRMEEVFRAHGIKASAIHSKAPNRDILLEDFRDNRIQVAFTVDLFNEGIDLPNVRVLMFLRPTESKTIFLQQLGRGLRIHAGKDRLRVLDFIGNYKRANKIRKYLSKHHRETEVNEHGRKRRKIVYKYSVGCEVCFTPEVEEILTAQDTDELGVNRTDLEEAYFVLAEKLHRKPNRSDLDQHGEYKSVHYTRLFGSWTKFLRSVGEYTEASYHYPQGTHLGHILSILKVFGGETRVSSHLDDKYIRLRGDLGEGRISTYRRQIKYKLQAAMELKIIEDDRNYGKSGEYSFELTPVGRTLYEAIEPLLLSLNLEFKRGDDGIPTTKMHRNESSFNLAINDYTRRDSCVQKIVHNIFLQMHAVQQMLEFLYHVCREPEIERNVVYESFFDSPAVKRYCDQEGIAEATIEASRRRCPFLINILEACDIVESRRTVLRLKKLVLTPYLLRAHDREIGEESRSRLKSIARAWPNRPNEVSDKDLSIARELFGPTFLTDGYFLPDLLLIDA